MLDQYGFLGTLKLIKSFFITKLFYKKARLIRLPFDIRNRKLINLGNNLTTGVGCRIEVYPQDNNKNKRIVFGDNVQINDYVHISSIKSVYIGDNVLMASKVFITDNNHGSYNGDDCDSPTSIPKERSLIGDSVRIEKNVWIGESVCVLPGVTIGEGAIIGSLSVVTRDIPKYSIAVGSPSRVIKKFDFELGIWIKV